MWISGWCLPGRNPEIRWRRIFGGGDAVARMALLFDRSDGRFGRTAIAASYDVTPLEESGMYDRVISYKREGIKPHLKEFVSQLDPAQIAVNVSRDMPIADGLTAGMRAYLVEVLGEDIAQRFVSSEPLVASFPGPSASSGSGDSTRSGPTHRHLDPRSTVRAGNHPRGDIGKGCRGISCEPVPP